MADLVVTVPKDLWLGWLAEGDLPGDPETDLEWDFYTYGSRPEIEPGERVYVVAHGRLRGYAPLVRLVTNGHGRLSFVRQAGAEALTIPEAIRGFRGWRYRWWERSIEMPFPDWKTADVPPHLRA